VVPVLGHRWPKTVRSRRAAISVSRTRLSYGALLIRLNYVGGFPDHVLSIA